MGIYRFTGDREFDPASGELSRDGTIVRLEPQPAAVLALLAGRPGEVVTHDEIRRAIWGDDTHVNFRGSVHYCIRQVRGALGESVHAAEIVETIPRRGYRLRRDALVDAEAAREPIRPIRFLPARLVIAGALVFLVFAAAIVERRPNNHHQIAVSVLRTVHDLVF